MKPKIRYTPSPRWSEIMNLVFHMLRYELINVNMCDLTVLYAFLSDLCVVLGVVMLICNNYKEGAVTLLLHFKETHSKLE